ncbi:hypothetical protein N658DRAFT_251003 [Parathielavia hyrcaniae]|uniref:Uncharacterized protein n=1 Tax=Parathielavia hyrcaniae TaxID=113614 RepID=A0AAN6T536_9PEZI|nr:hypothetical protein N658DRAFT_251003 [Parathielavia hyrcaniae]
MKEERDKQGYLRMSYTGQYVPTEYGQVVHQQLASPNPPIRPRPKSRLTPSSVAEGNEREFVGGGPPLAHFLIAPSSPRQPPLLSTNLGSVCARSWMGRARQRAPRFCFLRQLPLLRLTVSCDRVAPRCLSRLAHTPASLCTFGDAIAQAALPKPVPYPGTDRSFFSSSPHRPPQPANARDTQTTSACCPTSLARGPKPWNRQ